MILLKFKKVFVIFILAIFVITSVFLGVQIYRYNNPVLQLGMADSAGTACDEDTKEIVEISEELACNLVLKYNEN